MTATPAPAPAAAQPPAPAPADDPVKQLIATVGELANGFKSLKNDFIKHRIGKNGKGGKKPATKVAEPKTVADDEPNEDPDDAAEPAGSAGRTFAHQTRLSAEIATLPEAARNEVLTALEAEEISLEQALERVTWLKKGMGLGVTPGPSKGGMPKPPGVAGSAPPDPPTPTFATREEWEKFRRENRGDAMKLLESPNFDPTVLKRAKRFR